MYTIKNKASLFLLSLGTAVLLFATPSQAQSAKENAVYFPLILGAKSEARYVLTRGCVYEKYGCSPDSATMLFENGSVILNGVSACMLPAYGCEVDPRVTLFEDGSAIIYNK
jgi:hypothetical protein